MSLDLKPEQVYTWSVCDGDQENGDGSGDLDAVTHEIAVIEAAGVGGIVPDGKGFAVDVLVERALLVDGEGGVLLVALGVDPTEPVAGVLVGVRHLAGSGDDIQFADVGGFDLRLGRNPLVVAAQAFPDFDEHDIFHSATGIDRTLGIFV